MVERWFPKPKAGGSRPSFPVKGRNGKEKVEWQIGYVWNCKFYKGGSIPPST